MLRQDARAALICKQSLLKRPPIRAAFFCAQTQKKPKKRSTAGKQYCAGTEELDALFAEAEGEIEQAYRKLIPLLRQDETASEEARFYLGMLARLLLSAVLEGDRRDTAEFEQGAHFPESRSSEELHTLWEKLSARVDGKLNRLPHGAEVEKARCEISDRCRVAPSSQAVFTD